MKFTIEKKFWRILASLVESLHVTGLNVPSMKNIRWKQIHTNSSSYYYY